MHSYSLRSKRHLLGALALAGSALCLLLQPVQAQTEAWPGKPIKVIVNFPAGGAADQIARAVTVPLQAALGQPVVVENRGGAGGNIGGEAVAKSPADGYTLLMSSGGMVSVNPHLYPKMPFDPAKDLVSVAAAARVMVFLEARPTLPVNNVQEFMKYLKANPGKLSYGTPGNGSSPHLAAEMLKAQANVFAVHVPYRGAAPAMQDLLGGQIQIAFASALQAKPHIEAGKLKAIGVSGERRMGTLPNVPSLAEQGLNDEAYRVAGWLAFGAPAGTPPAILERIADEVRKATQLPDVAQRIAAMGFDVQNSSPALFSAAIAKERPVWERLIKASGAKLD